jgi:hypothetical protein
VFKPKLSDKQMEILKYIIKNPNQTENRIVIAFKGTYARETVLKAIKFLSDNKIIQIKIINNNQHEIIPNSKNLVTNLIQDLEILEDKTIILTKQLEKIVEQRKIQIDDFTIRNLYFVYQHQILMYLLHALVVWPSAIKDEEVLSLMYLNLFPKLRNILKHLENMKISLNDSKIDMIKSLTDSFFGLSPDVLNGIINNSHIYNINPEIERVLDIIWKNSKKFYPNIIHRFEKNKKQDNNNNIIVPETWQEALSKWNNNN